MPVRPLGTMLLAAGILAACSNGNDQPINGRWTIDKMVPAPWLAAGQSPDVAIAEPYLHKTVEFSPGQIAGPALLACENPEYRYVEVPPEGLFQGGLDDGTGHPAVAAKRATDLGFRSGTVHTVTTSCEHDIAFHMKDGDHAAFALDNMIFWMTRQN